MQDIKDKKKKTQEIVDSNLIIEFFILCFQITELKINSNPFAKGFREDGMNSKK